MTAAPTITREGHGRLMGVLLAALIVRALRVATSPNLPPPLADVEAATRSACAPETATPGAATPGAALPCNHSETQGMNTVPQAPVVALPAPRAPLADVGTAQHTALLRWHNRRPLLVVEQDMADNPRFPLISGGAA